jgi:hypothetical protein
MELISSREAIYFNKKTKLEISVINCTEQRRDAMGFEKRFAMLGDAIVEAYQLMKEDIC